MTLRLGLLACVLGLALLLSACGSGGGAQQQHGQSLSNETPRSERAPRQATIMQQQEQAPAAADQPAQSEQLDPSSEEPPGQESIVGSQIDFGHRKGLAFNRNVVGDPDAPVLIVEYSDFQ